MTITTRNIQIEALSSRSRNEPPIISMAVTNLTPR
jgi:hypothetical protein